MKSKIRKKESKGRTASFLMVAGLLLYWPVITGKIPIPSGAVLQFAAMQSAEPAPRVDPTAEMGDLITQVYPWRAVASQSIRSGAIPLWNFHTLLGAPLVANHQSAVFYPFNISYYLIPVPYAWALGFVTRFLLASGFCAWYSRSLGASRAGSLAAGLVFATCGSMTAWNGWTMVDSALWLPLGLLAVDRLRIRSGPGDLALAAVAFVMPVLAGHPEMALFVTVTVVLYAAFRIPFPLTDNAFGKLRFVRDFGVVGALAVALAAVQIFPTIEWLGNLEREVGQAAHWGSRPLDEMTALFSRDARGNPNSAGITIPEGAAYAGILAILLASLSPLLTERKRELIFFGLLLLVTLQITYGWGPFYSLVNSLPVFESIPNWRMILIANFSIAILAGFGLTAYQRQLERGRSSPAFWSLLLLGAILCSVGVGVLLHQTTGPAPAGAAWKVTLGPAWSAALVAVGVLALLPVGRMRKGSRVAIVLTVITLEMTSFAFGHIPFVERRTVFPEPLLYRWLKEHDPSIYRVAALDGTTSANLEMVFGIDSPVGYDFPTTRTGAILAPLRPSHAPGHLSAELLPSIDPDLLDLMNVRYIFSNEWVEMRQPTNAIPGVELVASDGPAHLFRRATALERIFLVPASGAVTVAKDEEALERVLSPSFDPRREVILTGSRVQAPESSRKSAVEPKLRVHSIDRDSDSFTARVETSVPAVAIFSDIHYPGWEVEVNDRPAELLLVNYAFKGVRVPPGTSLVTFVYDPPAFRLGMITSLLALSTVAGLTLIALRRRKEMHAASIKAEPKSERRPKQRR